MAKSLLKKDEFVDHVAFEFVKISEVDLGLQMADKLYEEDARKAFELQMRQKRQELEDDFNAKRAQMKEQLEKERIEILEANQKEAQLLLDKAKKQIEEREKEANERIASLLDESHKEKESILSEAYARREELIKEGESSLEEVREEARFQGYNNGYEEAYAQAQEHLDSLFANVQSIADHLLARRQQILKESQGQLTAILLSVMRKIIYKLTDSQQELVVKTIQKALLHVTSHTDILLRVNPADFALVEQWEASFKERFKNLKSIKVFEDSSVERGGCIVETDFGEIDARIATQISRMEEKILEINPMLVV